MGLIFSLLAFSCLLTSIVASPFPGETYFPGYITLEQDYSLFYWLFRSRDKNPAAPFIFWVQGGPGCSSTSSALGETGPYEIDQNLKLYQRQYSMNDFADVLFVDQPLGTGFSNCSNKDRIPRNEAGVVKDLLNFYEKFLAKFPELRARGVYLVGQSYAGHYVPAMAKGFLEAGYKVNGAAINNGWYKPDLHTEFRGQFAARHKLAPPLHLALGRFFEIFEVLAIKLGWYNIAVAIESLVKGFYQGFDHLRFNQFDIRLPCPDEFKNSGCYNDTLLTDFIARKDVREELGVGDREFIDCNDELETIMREDFWADMTPIVVELLDKYELKMIFYDGEYDFECDIDGQKNWMDTMPWKHGEEMLAQVWHNWYIDGEVMGKYRAVRNVIQAVIYDAGHLVTADQPSVMLDAIHRLIYVMKQ